MIDLPEKTAANRDELGRFGVGNNANPNGRPKGKTLKEFARQYLMSLSDEDKLEYLAQLPKEIVWRMSEGNPTEDKNVKISVPVPILGGSSQAITAIEEQTPPSSLPEGQDKPLDEHVAQSSLYDIPTEQVQDKSSSETTPSSLLVDEIMDA